MKATSGLDIFDALRSDGRRFADHLAEASSELRDSFLESLLNASRLDEALVESLTAVLQGQRDELPDLFCGGVYFFLFSHAAEKFATDGHAEDKATANAMIAKAETRRFVSDKYEVPEFGLEGELTLYRVGTTSFIISVDEKYALKLLKFPYCSNPHVVSATKQYEKKYGNLQGIAPIIHKSGEHFLLMDLIRGLTLREHFEALGALEIRRRSDVRSRLNEIKWVVEQLTDSLHRLQKRSPPLLHLDISPENLIVRDDGGDQRRLILIDFGYNYILQEKIGATQQILGDRATVAPELEEDPAHATTKADIYSIGMLLLFIFTGERPDVTNVGPHLDQTWQEYPEVAGLIESMIDGNPHNRLVEKSPGEDDYSYLRSELNSAFDLFIAAKLERESGWRRGLSSLPVLVFGDYRKLLSLARQLQVVQGSPDLRANYRSLLRYSVLSQMAHSVVLLVSGFYFADDVGWLDLNETFPFSRIGAALGVSDIAPGGWRENLWGRLVGVSFSIVAARYYQNIFSGVSARELGRRAEFWLRINSFFFAFPILWLTIVEPRHWPICSAIGVAVVAVNNLSSHASAEMSLRVIRDHLAVPLSTQFDQFLRMYKAYGVSSVVYAATLFATGIVLTTGLAKDEPIYSVVVSLMVNMISMYYLACTLKGPLIRGNLMRLFAGYRRAMVAQAESRVV